MVKPIAEHSKMLPVSIDMRGDHIYVILENERSEQTIATITEKLERWR